MIKINNISAVLAVFFLSTVFTAAAQAQVATGGVYRIDQSLIASGGATDSSGGTYALNGSIGEAVAGTTSSAGVYSVKGGFLSSPALAPTAASVSISGRVQTLDGSGLINARVTLTDSMGGTRTILTRKRGAFRFDDVEAGAVYIITVNSRRYTFAPQVISVMENLADINFTAQKSTVLQ